MANGDGPHHRYRLPRHVALPRGYRVGVVLVEPAVLADLMDEEDWPASRRSPAGWISEDMTIYIRDDLTPVQRWREFWHELLHAVPDVGHMDDPTRR